MTNSSKKAPMTQNPCYGQFIKPLVWDDKPKENHVYKCVSVSYVELPVQGDWKSHISICDEDNYGFKATLWLMNGGYGITSDCYCQTIEEAKQNAEEWWVNFVSGFLNCP
jgi:hypothetical protein